MQLTSNKRAMVASAVFALFGAATLAPAQEQRDRNRQDERAERSQADQDQRYKSRRFDDRRGDQRQADRDRDRRGQREARLAPSGWVRIGTDYDNDGRFEAVETIFLYDLERARRTSRDRAREGQHTRTQDDQRRESQSRQDRDRQQHHVQGEIQELRRENFSGIDDEVVIARIQTSEGRTAKALLGPRSQLSDLDLSEGDQITVQGSRGHVNDKMMLVAHEVRSGNSSASVDMPRLNLKRARGEVLSKRTARFRGFDESFVVAEVELVSGKRETVNLGPESKVRQLNLSEGDQISLLVRPGRINGQPAMIAEQIRADGQTVEVPRPQDRERFRRTQSDRQRADQSGRNNRSARQSQDDRNGDRR
jgi:hypothetical protein